MAGGFKAEGEKPALASLEGLPARFRLGIGDAAHAVGKLLVRTTQNGMQQSGGGRLYPGMPRQSSLPGNYPAVQSAQLLKSIDFEVEGMKLEFGSKGAFSKKGFDYAIAQNQGTTKMAPRPYLELTVAKTGAEAEMVLGRVVWQKLIGGGSALVGPVKP